jgi:hypothetical protein
MIWAVDLDDDDFSALSGLVKRSIGVIVPPDPGSVNPNGDALSQHWGNGGTCTISCHSNDDVDKACKKEDGFVKMGTRTGYCGKNKVDVVCCPTTNAPSSCEWRGGESSGLCNGQCHQGEINLLSIRGSDGDGSHHHCTSGWQIFCCKADRWAALIDQCRYEKCEADCSSGYEEIAKAYTTSECNTGPDQGSPFSPPSSGYRKFCCPKPVPFSNCHWVGKGDCGDNTCTKDGKDDGSIEVMTDRFGDGTSTCRWSRNKALCCNPPDIEAFSPVKLEYLFPELPPLANDVKFDTQSGIGSTGSTTQPGQGTWGLIVIDGPESSVSSVNKRDGSHLEFIDCDRVQGEHRQTVRYICLNDGAGSNCNDMLLDGIEGTVLKMPENCGPGTYAVAHKVGQSPNQSRPAHLLGISGQVMELTFDYNFGLVKRDGGDIFLRIDYSSVPSYWDDIVDEPGSLKKRDELRTRGFGKDDWWKTKYNNMRSGQEGVRNIDKTFSREVYANKESCSGGDDAYLDIKADISAQIEAKWGFTLIGKISPWSVSEAYTFFDAVTKVGMDYSVSARGKISSDDTTEFPLQRTALSMYEFRHPGIGHFRPWFNADVGVTAQMEMEGNFSVSYQTSTAGSLKQGYPSSGLGSPTGNGVISPKGSGKAFQGAIKQATNGGFKIRTTTQTGLEIVFNNYGNSGEFLGLNITGTTDSYTAVQVENKKFTVSIGSDKASAALIYASGGTETISAFNPDSSQTRLIGERLGAKQVDSGSPGDDDHDPKKGPNPHYIEYDGDATLAHFKTLLTCPTGLRKEPKCNFSLCKSGDLDCSNDEDGPGEAGRACKRRNTVRGILPAPEELSNTTTSRAQFETLQSRKTLVPRVTQRTFTVLDGGITRTLSYFDEEHVHVGDWCDYEEDDEGDIQMDNAYTMADWDDCTNADIVTHALPENPVRPPEGTDRDFASRCPYFVSIVVSHALLITSS